MTNDGWPAGGACRTSRRLRAARCGHVALAVVLPAVAALGALPASNTATATIEIDAARVDNRISPLLYGQFAEFMFEGVKGGLHAELIRNRSFEEAPNAIGLSREWDRYPDDRNDDYGLAFAWDSTTAYPEGRPGEGLVGGHSLRVALKAGVIERHGVYQARVPVRARGHRLSAVPEAGARREARPSSRATPRESPVGEADLPLEYRGYVWLKGEGFRGDVRVALERDVSGGPVYAESVISGIGGGDWKQHAFTLRPGVDDPLARFAILLSGEGTVWVDQVSLMPGDAVDGVRADVLDRVKALRPAFVRWPGGNVAQDYRWQWGVGPRDRRPTWTNLSWKHEPEPGDFGTDEFVRFARNAGAEPSITVNVEGRGATVQEAAAWVEYCNGPASSTYGAMRARNGHPEPYRVRFWEIGNEIWGDWVRGHSDAATYARNLTRYVAALRAVDPGIEVIAVGDNDMAWNRTVLRETSGQVDYLAIHHYYGRRAMENDLRNLMARPLHYERFYADLAAQLRQLPAGRRPKLAINEWGLDLPESQQHSILSALYGARLMNVFERSGGLVEMSAVSDLVNGWPGGIIQASRHGVFVTPIYLVNRLYANSPGAQRLATRVDGPVFSTTREGTGVPALDVVASRSADGRRIFVKAVNTDLERAVQARVTVRGAGVASGATVERVVADSLAAVNSFATPEAVRVTTARIAVGGSFSLDLPKHSVAVVTLTVE